MRFIKAIINIIKLVMQSIFAILIIVFGMFQSIVITLFSGGRK